MKKILFLFLIPISAFADHSTSALNIYNRLSSNQNSGPLETMNVIYDFPLSELLKGEVGMRFGETQWNFSHWNYKAEIQTKWFFNCLNFMSRFTKVNTFWPSNQLKSVFMNRVKVGYRIGSSTLSGALGATFTSTSTTASIVAPSFGGSNTWTPTFLAAVAHEFDSIHQIYSLRFANYDVFDVYPTNTPYWQLEIEQELNKFALYAYGRWRYENVISNLYSFYLAVGVVIPLGEDEDKNAPHPMRDK